MRRIEQADVELVAHVRPRHLADERHVEAFRGGEAAFHGDDQGSRVDERDKTDAQSRAHLNNSAAVTTDWAMSTIFLFSFMAVLRSSA